jgi:hypothetical protein
MFETVSIPVQQQVELGRLAQPAHVDRRKRCDHRDTAEHVARRMLERRPEHRQVMRDEERGDRDRDDVVQSQGPAGHERCDLVEGVAGERGGPAGLREHRGTLRIRLGRQHEQPAGQHEHDRREAQRVRRH